MFSRGIGMVTSPVSLEKDVALQPNTEHIAWGLVENPQPGTEAVLNPVRQVPGDILVASTLVHMDQRVPVRLANFSDEVVHLRAGVLVGDLVEAMPSPETPRQESRREVARVTMQEASVGSDVTLTRLPVHLHGLFAGAAGDLGDSGADRLVEVLSRCAGVFARRGLDLGCFPAVKHRINTGGARPIRQPPRRTPLGFEGEEEGYLRQMLGAGIVGPSRSEWASPVVLVRKKDGGVGWCVDYRRLNAVTERDAYPLPKIEECLDTLSGATWFSTLDLQSGYWQVEMAPEDRDKTAFTTKYGLFQYTRMSFGLCNAPSTFQRAMEVAMQGLQWKTLLVYIDDLIIVSATLEEHLERLQEVFERLRQQGVKLKPRKCNLLRREALFLGHVVDGDGIRTNPALVRDIQERTAPRTVRELQAFLGLCNYYRRFVPSFAQIAAPLNHLLTKGTEFAWGPPQQAAFEELICRLTNSPILAYPQREGTFVLDTDASDTCLGAVLSQRQGGEERVISYASVQLEPAHRRYCVTRRELLAVVRFTRMFRHYLLGRKFILRTDHNSLTWLFRFKAPQGQLARWLEELCQYDLTIEHRAGAKHGNADALSRMDTDDPSVCDCYRAGGELDQLPCQGCSHCRKVHEQWSRFDEEVDYVVPLAVRRAEQEADPPEQDRVEQADVELRGWLHRLTPDELRRRQEEDPVLGVLLRWKAEGRPSQNNVSLESSEVKHYWLCWRRIEERGGVLHYLWEEDDGPPTPRLLVPKSLREDLLVHSHRIPTGGHSGVERMLARLRLKYHWRCM